MNDLLRLSGEFQSKSANRPSHPTLPSKVVVTSEQLYQLAKELESCLMNWQGGNLLDGILVEVHYKTIIAKSNRMKHILASGSHDPEESICGARYEDNKPETPHHVMVHYVSREVVDSSIDELKIAASLTQKFFPEGITKDQVDTFWKEDLSSKQWEKKYESSISRNHYVLLLHDTVYVTNFSIPSHHQEPKGQMIATFYKTEKTTSDLLEALGINIIKSNTLDNTALLSEREYKILQAKAPYLIAMTTIDLSEIDKLSPGKATTNTSLKAQAFPKPTAEPIIGVIDTPFEEKYPPYFSDWVETENLLPEEIKLRPKDYEHGTFVASLIVDGPGLNPDLEDGCGHFRVKHFGVATAAGFSSFDIVKNIDRIIEENPQIRVWNLSLGAIKECEKYSISPEASILDRIQSQRDILFVIAGTNDQDGISPRLGAPADSINSLVVGAVRRNGTPTSYSRKGPVLDFFKKPDVAYYGGDIDEELRVCCGTGAYLCKGTSFAAPLIARKAAFLMCKMGLPRDVTKALLIDAARGWSRDPLSNTTGYGVVPIRIEDILESPNNEIKFYISGTAVSYETYNYGLPIPHTRGYYPYETRAVLTYCPTCTREQGVDYTDTELDLHLGRLNGGRIQHLKRNFQGDPEDRTREDEARKRLRKWDNVKYVTDAITLKPRGKKVYNNPLWGIKIRKTARFSNPSKAESKPQPFGLVVTLREINGANRIEGFIQQCFANGWMVNRVNIANRLKIQESSQVEIKFE